MNWGYIGSMQAKPGHREELVSILLGCVERFREAGCSLYLVTMSATDDDTVWVTEIWNSKEHHDAALQQSDTRAAIEAAKPLLTGATGQELKVVGGLGL